jgi:hypothetical protein
VMVLSISPSRGDVDMEEEQKQRAAPPRSCTTTDGTSLPSLAPSPRPCPVDLSFSSALARLLRARESRQLAPQRGAEAACGPADAVEHTGPMLLQSANHWPDPARVLDSTARPRQPTQSFNSCSPASLPVQPAAVMRSSNPFGIDKVVPTAHTNATYVRFSRAEQRRVRYSVRRRRERRTCAKSFPIPLLPPSRSPCAPATIPSAWWRRGRI